MKIFKNSDGSFDIVNTNRVLFHAKNGTCKVIGRVNEQWRTASKQVSRLPLSVMKFRDIIETSKI
jgi:hypothetical protein